MSKLSAVTGMLSIGFCAALGVATSDAGAKNGSPVPSPVVSFDPALGELPESLTTDDEGHLLVSLVNGQIREITPGQSMSTLATVPLPPGGQLTGIKLGPDGLIYATSSSFNPADNASIVWRITPETGESEQFATLDPTGFPNDIAFDDDGNVFVTDPFLGLIWRLDASGEPSVWLSDPLLAGNPDAPVFAVHDFGVDGIAFDQNKKNLYVGNLDYGRILRIPFGCHTGPDLEVVAESPDLIGTDGIALDRRGTVYAAVNPLDRIATVDRQGHVSILFEGSPLDAPSSIVFGTGHSDKKTIYISNFAINRVLAGLPASPGVVSLPVQTPGVPLP